MNRVTAVLLNYKRPDNTAVLIESLYSQTEPVSILLIDNGKESRKWAVDRVVRIPWNAGCYVRTLFALYVNTEWVVTIDDDLMLGDTELLGESLRIAEQHSLITGAFGRRLSKVPPHYEGRPDADRSEFCSVVKGRFMVYRRSLLDRIPLGTLMQQNDYRIRCDDLCFSLETGHGESVHWIDFGLRRRLIELPWSSDMGLEHHPDHYRIRERFCAEYFEQRKSENVS
jgi:glycosyltransferase involved in cell wall biosynthesis